MPLDMYFLLMLPFLTNVAITYRARSTRKRFSECSTSQPRHSAGDNCVPYVPDVVNRPDKG